MASKIFGKRAALVTCLAMGYLQNSRADCKLTANNPPILQCEIYGSVEGTNQGSTQNNSNIYYIRMTNPQGKTVFSNKEEGSAEYVDLSKVSADTSTIPIVLTIKGMGRASDSLMSSFQVEFNILMLGKFDDHKGTYDFPANDLDQHYIYIY